MTRKLNPPAASGERASRPTAADSQEKGPMNRTRTPRAASQSSGPASGRNPIAKGDREHQGGGGEVADQAGGDVAGQDRGPGDVHGPEPVDDAAGHVGGHTDRSGGGPEPGAQQHPGDDIGHIAGAGVDGPPNR
jgi:hypothetical protein